MKKNIKGFLVLLCAILGGIIINLVSLCGETYARAIVMSPMSQRAILVPGETYRGGFKIANPEEYKENLRYVVEVHSFSVSSSESSPDDYGNIDYETRTGQNMIVDWITVDNPVGEVEPGKDKTISFSIRVPEDAPGGGQYATFVVRENPDFQVLDDSLAVNEVIQMAHILYASVGGDTVEKGYIVENTIPSFSLNGDVKTSSLVKNEGNVHADARYVFQVWPIFSDEEICTNEEEAETSLILPGTTRYHSSECKLPFFGIFRAKQTIRIFGEESVVEKIVFVCPIWLMFLIIFLITLVIIWFFTRSKARKGSKKSKGEEQ